MRTIQTKVFLVLMLCDAYTGAAVDSRDIQVRTKGAVSFRKKENGCIVFCDFSGETVSVQLESPYFQQKRIEITANRGTGPPSIQTVWLYPGKKYPLDSDAVVAKGQAESRQKLIFYPIFKKNGYRLMADAEGMTETIHIFHRARESLEGRHILLYPGNQKLVLGEENPKAPGEFRVKKVQLEPARRRETQVCLGYEGEADQNGTYWIAAKGDGQYPVNGILDIEGELKYICIQSPSGV